MTLVSTIIPTHNRCDVLAEAIESVLAQSVDDHEIIVVDDNSTDDTKDVVSRYPVLYLHVVCGKPSMTRNAGIRASTGEYIAFLDDDDVWLPNRLRPALNRLQADPEAVMIYAQMQVTDWTLTERRCVYPQLPLPEGHPVREFLETVISCDALLIRRSVLDTIGMFDETIWGAEDMDFTVRLARAGKCLALQECVSMCRVPSDAGIDAAKPIIGGTSKWVSRHQDDTSLLEKHFSVADAYQPTLSERRRILRKRNGWFVDQLLEHAAMAKRANLAAERRAALQAAIIISPIHCLKNPRYWRLLLSK